MDKINPEEKTAKPLPTLLKNLPAKQDQKIKDPQYDHRLLQILLKTKNHLDKQEPTSKTKNTRVRNYRNNKFRLLEKMETV